MKITRRTALEGVVASFSTLMIAGCLTDDSSNENDNESGNGDDNGDGSGNEDDNGNGDVDNMSIDGRLHNTDTELHTFEIEIRDADDSVITSDEKEVSADSSEAIPAVGTPSTPRTFTVTVNGETATETFDFDVEATPEKIDGYVDITYTQNGNVEIEFTPTENDS